jgi:hypothetical protein
VFVGGAGESDDQRTRSGLVAVVDGTGIPLHVSTGAAYVPVLVTEIHNGVGFSVIGSDYYTNPTVEFTPSIPAGQTYRLVHYLRGNLKTQPLGAYTRLADGIRGAEDLWAYAKTTRLGNTTFTGNKVFSDLMEIAGPVTFLAGVSADQPKISFAEVPASASQYVLISQVQVTTAPDNYYRWYFNGESVVRTYNARWDLGSGDWFSDNVGNVASYVVAMDASDGEDHYIYKQAAPASWPNADWGVVGDIQRRVGIFIGKRADDGPDDVAGVAVSTFVSGRPDLWPNADPDYVLDLTGSSSDRGQARVYNTFERTGLVAGLSYTRNAGWDNATHKWASDEDTKGAASVGLTRDGWLSIRTKDDTATDWDDVDGWDVDCSLQGFYMGTWSWWPPGWGSSAAIAVRPGIPGVREETWVIGPTSDGANAFRVGPHPAGPFTSVASSSLAEANTVVWDESTNSFYAILNDGTVDASVDGLDAAWFNVGSVATSTNQLRLSGNVNGCITYLAGGTDVYEAASPAGPWVLVTAFMVLHQDFLYHAGSDRWIACGTIAAGQTGLWYSSDRVNWSVAALAGPAYSQDDSTRFLALALNPEDNILLAIGANDHTGDDRTLFARSTDGGLTWTREVRDDIDQFQPKSGVSDRFFNSINYINGRFLATGTGPGGNTVLVGDRLGDNWVHVPGVVGDAGFVVSFNGRVAYSKRTIALAAGNEIRMSATLTR